jgi:DNA-binding response OmpR family regulator
MRLLLIQEDAVLSRELSLRWEHGGWLVERAATLHQADAALRRRAPDLVVLDLDLNDSDGLVWLERLRRSDRLTPVLVLSARDRVVDRVQGLKTGADDYVVKPFAGEELDVRIEVLTRRAQAERGDVAQFGELSWSMLEGRALAGSRALELSPREFEVLGMLIRRAPRLLPKRVLVEALAAKNLELGDSAAELYVSRLRRKLLGCGIAIQTVRGFGYQLIFEGERPATVSGARL